MRGRQREHDVGAGAREGAPVTARQVGRARGLPSGRAVVGGFLIALAAVLVFAASRGVSDGPTHRFVIARHDIAAGTVLAGPDVELIAVDLPDPSASRAFVDSAVVLGRVAVAPIARGELLQASAVTDRRNAPIGFQVSMPVERARALDGALQAGEVVDVLVTYSGAAASRTLVVARLAQVVRVDSASRSAIAASNDLVIVLAVPTEDEVLAITHGSQAGKVTLVRSTGPGGVTSSADSYAPPGG